MSLQTLLLNDVSTILFDTETEDHDELQSKSLQNNLPIIGPIAISTSSSNPIVHGCGLIATRNIRPGECLMIIPPTVSADIRDVYRVWSSSPSSRLRSSSSPSLENVAETTLLKLMRRHVRRSKSGSSSLRGGGMPTSCAITASFMMLCYDQNDSFAAERRIGSAVAHSEEEMLQTLLAQRVPSAGASWWSNKDCNVKDETLLGIMRRNAFGPEFQNYITMEEGTWRTTAIGCGISNVADKADNNNKNDDDSNNITYRRILGLYPLAAMINYSCHPNAMRAFATTKNNNNECMIVHANAPIEAGEEILWSYIPPHKYMPGEKNNYRPSMDLNIVVNDVVKNEKFMRRKMTV